MIRTSNTIFMTVALAGLSASAHATNGDQMLGVTATQWGMAGAIVAAPQDAGTVLTNPAGLAGLGMNEVRFDTGFGFLNPMREANGDTSDSNLYLIPSGGLALRVNDDVVFGMGMAGLSGMGVDFEDTSPLPGNQAVVTNKQFYKIAPGFAYRMTDRLALGAALNIDYQSLAMYTPQFQLPQNQVYGYGASFGITYALNDQMRLGASYITQQEMDPFKWNTLSGRYEMTMDAPAQLALGVAWHPGEEWLVELDAKYIWFSEVLDRVELRTPTGNQTLTFGWDDQTVFALGVQRRLDRKTTVRAGLNYGESPIGPEDVTSNIGSLAVTETHAALGLTRSFNERTSGSLSFVRAFKNEVRSNSSPASIELEQNIVNLQISYQN
jgi:long-chain fatty acid transport protein